MVKMMRFAMVFVLLSASLQLMAEDVDQTVDAAPAEKVFEEQAVQAQLAPVVVADAKTAEKPQEDLVQVAAADAAPTEIIEDATQVASIDDELLDAADKILGDDVAAQLAGITDDSDFDLNFEDLDFDEEEGL